ncbi:MAG: hypothetical protein INR65_13655 [Gluconacetobacter diazotrophicus]|nr:hypothetical protein [Gluconacetobacter diazotrophicus]
MIEVMLAIAILAIICGTIYNFTNTVLRSASVATSTDERAQSFDGLRRLLEAQFSALPVNENGVFVGLKQEGEHGHRDAIQVVCPAGNALLTPDAHGLYRTTLGMDELPHGSGHYALVMEREPRPEDDDENGNGAAAFQLPAVSAGGVKTNRSQLPSDSVRLFGGVRALEISYYDPRLNSWQDKWNDDTMIPSLVRVRLTMEGARSPYEFIEQVPSGGIRRGLPNTVATGIASGIPGIPTGNVLGAVGPNGATVPNLPAGLSVPPPPPNMAVPGLPPGMSAMPNPNRPVAFPNAPIYSNGAPR